MNLPISIVPGVTNSSSGYRWCRIPHDVERVNVNAQPADMRYRGNVAEYQNDLHGGPVEFVPPSVTLDWATDLPLTPSLMS